jgi:hypothetical protein
MASRKQIFSTLHLAFVCDVHPSAARRAVRTHASPAARAWSRGTAAAEQVMSARARGDDARTIL